MSIAAADVPLLAVAATTMVVLALADLHGEVVAGAAAWVAAWRLVRERA